MTAPPRVQVLLGAFALGLKARLEYGVSVQEVDELRATAEAVLPPGDDVRAAVIMFASAHQLHHRNRAAMVEVGAALERSIERATRPEVPGLERVDIHG